MQFEGIISEKVKEMVLGRVAVEIGKWNCGVAFCTNGFFRYRLERTLYVIDICNLSKHVNELHLT